MDLEKAVESPIHPEMMRVFGKVARLLSSLPALERGRVLKAITIVFDEDPQETP